MNILNLLKSYNLTFFIFTLVSFLLIETAVTNSLFIETPLAKPNETEWRQKSNISIPEPKPDPPFFMLAIPSNVEAPKRKPDPKSIYPMATRSLTEMVFKKTNIFISIEDNLSVFVSYALFIG